MRPSLVALLLAGCAGATPAVRPVATEGAVAARIVEVEPPGGGSRFATAVVQFTNGSERPIVVRRFTLEWDGGQATSIVERLVVPPGGTVQRRFDTRSYDAAAVRDGRVVIETPSAVRASVLE